MNVYGGWCVTLPTHVPVLDDLGNIVYEQKTTKHKDGTITEDTVPKLREVQYTGEETKARRQNAERKPNGKKKEISR